MNKNVDDLFIELSTFYIVLVFERACELSERHRGLCERDYELCERDQGFYERDHELYESGTPVNESELIYTREPSV